MAYLKTGQRLRGVPPHADYKPKNTTVGDKNRSQEVTYHKVWEAEGIT
jgi:hypothetical protein